MKQILFWVAALTLGFSALAAVPSSSSTPDVTRSVEWVQVGVSMVTLVGGAFGFCVAYFKWQKEVRQKRAEVFKNLMDNLNANEIWCMARDSDADLNEMGFSLLQEKSREVQSLLMKISYVLYSKKKGHIDDDEFAVFELGIRKFLSSKTVLQILEDAHIAIDGTDVANPYCHIEEYRKKAGIVAKDFRSSSAQEGEPDGDDLIMLIRISRQYREDMTPEDLRESTFRWWRIRPDKKPRYVMSVAKGEIKAVYLWKGWEEGSGVVEGRVGVIGEEAGEADKQKYVGKSVKALFLRGAANPVRYVKSKELDAIL